MGLAGTAGGLLPSGCGAPAWDAPRPVPKERWDVEDCMLASDGAREARFGAFVDAADLFDAAAFNISRSATLALFKSLAQ